jgi:8-oxo-dGTP pyrophosphatase MutT (NUDIX family)
VDVDAPDVIRAAGGVVIRSIPEPPLLLLVHRPHYDDWSLPKGKNRPGERDEDAAVREVEEETGLQCTLGAPAGETRYRSRAGPKVVRYWLMEAPPEPVFVPNREVDEVRWCSRREAGKLLTYPHDRQFVSELPENVL